jgi:adenylate cyclase
VTAIKAKVTFFIWTLLLPALLPAQDVVTDSLTKLVNESKADTSKVNALLALGKSKFNTAPEEAILISAEADSLSRKLGFAKGSAMALKNVGISYYMQGKYVDAINTWQQSLTMFEKIGDKKGVANILSNLGAIYFNQSDEAKALEFYLKSLKISEDLNDSLRIATACINIGAVYFDKPATHDKALQYYLRAVPISEALGDLDAIGTSTSNLGEIYMARNQDSLALVYFEKSMKALEGSENIPSTLNNIGKVYLKRSDFVNAIKYHTLAFDISEKLEAKLDMTQSLLGLASTYQKKGDNKLAIETFKKSEVIARSLEASKELKVVYEGLALVYAAKSDFGNAFKYQSLLIGIKDTLYNIDTDKKLSGLLFNFEMEKKQGQIDLLTKDKELKELDLQRQKVIKNVTFGGLSMVLLFLGVVLKQKKKITAAKKRSDELLLNILPEETAEELKETGTAKAKSFDQVTVMFTDFKNFTQASELLSAEELVEEINLCYSEFDRIITKYGIEKIKTIGDSYMCAGGIPVTNATHPVDVVKAGLEMQAFITKNKETRIARGEPFFDLRLGVHTGPVVAGIVGIKKFAYDIWGDTVNTASRMESSGEIGKVNVSGFTYELIKDHFKCSHRGKIEAKNKGQIDMYFVESIIDTTS